MWFNHSLLGKCKITHHAFNQYDDRATFKRKGDIFRSIKHDLRTLNITNIVYGETVNVFTKGYKEFIFIKGRDGQYYLKTFIKRNREDTQRTLYKRKSLVTN